MLVQPFAEEVPRDGEYSFMFIDGEFSHATIKRARRRRVSRADGASAGRVDAIDARAESRRAGGARRSPSLPETPLYARVDGIARGDAFLLMELELIEPNLFLETAPGAAERLRDAIAGRLESAH